MTSDTRAKMVAGAADLMSRRGVNATSMREVVRHTGTPRGSIGHHFPGGKQQLIEDALVFAGKQVSGPLEHLTQWRMVRAASLIREQPSAKLAAIAAAVGYRSEGAFGKVFRRALGVSPGQYRQLHAS